MEEKHDPTIGQEVPPTEEPVTEPAPSDVEDTTAIETENEPSVEEGASVTGEPSAEVEDTPSATAEVVEESGSFFDHTDRLRYSVPSSPLAPVQPGKNMALTSMILGILSLWCCGGVFGIPIAAVAIVLAAVSRKRAGVFYGTAIAGLIMGILGVLFGLISILFIVFIIIVESSLPEDPYIDPEEIYTTTYPVIAALFH